MTTTRCPILGCTSLPEGPLHAHMRFHTADQLLATIASRGNDHALADGVRTLLARFNGTAGWNGNALYAALRQMIRQHACCDLHGRNCEPPAELCCRWCTEATHPDHYDGTNCSAPDLSATAAKPRTLAKVVETLLPEPDQAASDA